MAHKILIIDDSKTMREVLKVYLMGGQYEFIEAESAHRALDLLRLVRVDLVIADINMPKMDGITFVQHVRASDLPNVKTVPIILVTSDKSEALRVKGREAHADAFLQKPLQADVLFDVVATLIRQKPRT